MTQKKVYDKEFKIQAVKLEREIEFSEPSEVSKNLRMRFIAIKTNDGRLR